MLEITESIRIPSDELRFAYARAGGPGGQNVNKVSSKVWLRWNAVESSSLPGEVKGRLLSQQRAHLTREGELLISSQKTRDQLRNVKDCLEKLRDMILRALVPPKPRKRSRPTRASKERRLQGKRLQSRRKAGRQKPSLE